VGDWGTMARSARRPKRPAHVVLISEGAAALASAVARNPVLVGGSTAFLVALSFVSANALWYQPHFHNGAFFATRSQPYTAPQRVASSLGDTETTIRLLRPETPTSDPTVQRVQSILRDLDIYAGPVDGIAGPNTRAAIANYRAKVGLTAGDSIDAELLDELGASPTTAGVNPTPRPASRVAGAEVTGGDALVAKVQAGLKAFGNEGIEVDGVVGARTESAIREFQSLFGLPVTGKPDAALYAKMQDIGLTN
jgi:peptidoglycan hydrolase-like protein with peptidoglycan-binding domain